MNQQIKYYITKLEEFINLNETARKFIDMSAWEGQVLKDVYELGYYEGVNEDVVKLGKLINKYHLLVKSSSSSRYLSKITWSNIITDASLRIHLLDKEFITEISSGLVDFINLTEKNDGIEKSVIRATIRSYLSEFLIRALVIYCNVRKLNTPLYTYYSTDKLLAITNAFKSDITTLEVINDILRKNHHEHSYCRLMPVEELTYLKFLVGKANPHLWLSVYKNIWHGFEPRDKYGHLSRDLKHLMKKFHKVLKNDITVTLNLITKKD